MFGLLPLLPKPYDYLFFLDFLRFQVQHMFQNLFFFFFYFKKSYTVISLSPQIRCLFFLWNLFKFYDSFFSFFFCFFFFFFSFVLFFCGGKMIKVSVYLISNFYLIFHVMFLVAFDSFKYYLSKRVFLYTWTISVLSFLSHCRECNCLFILMDLTGQFKPTSKKSVE